jgi:hypothetical protein
MKLSELLSLTPEQAESHTSVARGVFGLSVYSVDVDTADDLTPPTWLKEIGVVLKINDQGEVDENVLDVAISYRLAKIKVMIEVPFMKDGPNEDYLIASIATNMQVALSFLPPEEDTEDAFQGYLEQTRRVCQAFFKRPNLDQMVMPITNYLEYLFVHLLVPDRPFQVKDPYVLGAYATVLGDEKVDRLKDVIREETYLHFGGEEGFEVAAKALMSGIYGEAVKITDQARERLEQNRAAQQQAGAPVAANDASDEKGELK